MTVRELYTHIKEECEKKQKTLTDFSLENTVVYISRFVNEDDCETDIEIEVGGSPYDSDGPYTNSKTVSQFITFSIEDFESSLHINEIKTVNDTTLIIPEFKFDKTSKFMSLKTFLDNLQKCNPDSIIHVNLVKGSSILAEFDEQPEYIVQLTSTKYGHYSGNYTSGVFKNALTICLTNNDDACSVDIDDYVDEHESSLSELAYESYENDYDDDWLGGDGEDD